jgi:hypothetical protein
MAAGVWHDVSVELPEAEPAGAESVTVTVDDAGFTFTLSPSPKAPQFFEQLFGATQGTFAGTTARIRYERFRVVYLR